MIRERISLEFTEEIEAENPHGNFHTPCDGLRGQQFGFVSLTVVEEHAFDGSEGVQRPMQACGGILSAGKYDETGAVQFCFCFGYGHVNAILIPYASGKIASNED